MTAVAGSDAHLDEDCLVALAHGKLAASERAAAMAHVEGCAECRRLVAEAVREAGSAAPVEGSGESLAAFAATLPSEPRAALLFAGEVVGRYRVLEPIGAGGMGVVYAAHDPELDRQVALKLLRPATPGAEEAGRGRLVREAQAMARIHHPNVVTVYDAGSAGDQVFIAMELVDGRTLGEWLRERERGWREIVRTFVDAARGLAAAHAKGIVHRDFKPGNVLVSWGGAVRVTDFGLARTAGEGGAVPPSSRPSRPVLEAPGVTRTGALVGTPAYMPPEQYDGRPTDARSDQFAFAVALHEALFGARPFDGATIAELFANVRAGVLRTAERRRKVPARIGRALARALRADPDQRFPSMDALVDALAYDPRVRARRAATAAAVVALGVTAAVFGLRARHDRAAVCTGAERKLAGVWDDGRRAAVVAAFTKTGKPFAEEALRGVTQALDGYARAWTDAHVDACEATRVRGEQPEEVLTLRMVCLDERLRDMRELVGVLAEADAQTVEKSVQASRALPRIAGCADLAALTARVKPPGDAATAARVDDVRRRFAETRALLLAGKYARGLALAREAQADAAAAGYRPAQAEAYYWLGEAQQRTGDFAAAEASELEAAWGAEAVKDDDVAANAWTSLVWLVGYKEARVDEGFRLARQAGAAIERLGGRDDIQAELELSIATLLHAQGKYDEAADRDRRAIVLREKALGPDDPTVAAAIGNLGAALGTAGHLDEALEAYLRALHLRERLLGPDHPDVASSLVGLAVVYRKLGRLPEAIATYERALRIIEASYGDDHAWTGMCLNNLAFAQSENGQHAEALANAERALAIDQKRLGPDHPDVADALDTMGHALLGLHRTDEAIARFEQATAVSERASGPSHPSVAIHLTSLGVALLAAGRPKSAIAPLERALAIRSTGAIAPHDLADTRFALARALWEGAGDRRRARELATSARDAYADGSARRGDVEAWLSSHA